MMSFEEFRQEMDAYRKYAIQEATAIKEMMVVTQMLEKLYGRFDEQERAMADRVIGEWALSEDSSVRFDALALIDTFHIVGALPALHSLLIRLGQSTEVGARHEAQKVGDIVAGLGADDQMSGAS